MAQAMSIGTGIVLDTNQVPFAQLSSTNLNIISNVWRMSRATSCGVQILTDGLSIVDYQVQMTGMPFMFGRAIRQTILNGITQRDESLGSNMWTTVASGQIPKGSTTQGVLVMLANTCHEDGRLIVTYDAANSGTSSSVYAEIKNTGF